ncbi:MAG: DNA-binding response regulator [Eubacterium sp.]|jgi:two-component system response regulator YesN|nr:DNA-binding response regulator [Eubacterium sp.]
MLNMLIADDEQIIVDGIKESIDWESFDINVAGTARNGVEALDLALKLHTDIIVTDIKMPGLNGLELVKEIRKLKPYVKIILMSAYEQFDFAQEAIELGVCSYITKPLKKQKIIEEVEKVRDLILQERSEKEKNNQYEELYLSNLPILREHYLNSLILGKTRITGDYKKQFNSYDIDIGENDVGVFVCAIDNIEETSEEFFEKSVQIIHLRITEMIRELISDKYRKTIFQSYSNEVVTIFNASDDYTGTIKDIALIAETIKNTLNSKIKISVSAGVGRIYPSLKEVAQSYQEAVKALNYRLVYGNNAVLYIDSVEIKNSKQEYMISDLNDILTTVQNILWTGKEEEVYKLISERITGLFRGKSIPYYYVQQVYCHLLSTLLRTTYEMNILPEQLYGAPVHLYGELFKKQTLLELQSWYCDLASRVCSIINDRKTARSGYVISMAVDYIKTHCNKDISLGEVAEYVNLNPSYLSRIFKEETGTQFVEYIRKVKMELAKELLKNTNKKIYGICEELGYQNVQYFSTIFKNTTGMTPLEFKKTGKC